MPFYTMSQLLQDNKHYIVDHYDQIQIEELEKIKKSKYYESYMLHIEPLYTSGIEPLLAPVQEYFPKTYALLMGLNLKYQVVISYSKWDLDLPTVKSFFSINDRIYWLTLVKDAWMWDDLPDFIAKGWGLNLVESYAQITYMAYQVSEH